MVLSKRERYIVTVTLVSVAILVFDRLVLTPVQQRKTAMEDESQRVLGGLERARALFARKRQLSPKWRQMLDAGLKSDPAEAESQVLHAVRNWSQEAGLSLSSLRPERLAQKGELREITFQASGTGPMSAVAGFLWRLESSSLPVRATELQLGTRKEGTDDLTVQLRLSAVCQSPSPQTAPGVTAVPAPTEEGKDHD